MTVSRRRLTLAPTPDCSASPRSLPSFLEDIPGTVILLTSPLLSYTNTTKAREGGAIERQYRQRLLVPSNQHQLRQQHFGRPHLPVGESSVILLPPPSSYSFSRRFNTDGKGVSAE